MVFEQLSGLQMELSGLPDLPVDSYGDYQDTMSAFVEMMYATSMDMRVEGLQTAVRVTATSTSSSGSRQLRQLQTSVTVTYEQDFEYLPLTAGVTAAFLATEPFSQEIGRTDFALALQDTDALIFGALESISEVGLPETEAPTAVPTEASETPTELIESPTISPTEPEGDDGGLSTGAIIGIAVAGVVVVLVIIYFSMCRSRDANEYSDGNPPNVVKASVEGDEVSTLGGAIGGGLPTSGSPDIYGDQR
jgi:hypothetical protein